MEFGAPGSVGRIRVERWRRARGQTRRGTWCGVAGSDTERTSRCSYVLNALTANRRKGALEARAALQSPDFSIACRTPSRYK